MRTSLQQDEADLPLIVIRSSSLSHVFVIGPDQPAAVPKTAPLVRRSLIAAHRRAAFAFARLRGMQL